MSSTPAAVRLLRDFDVDRLRRDLEACERAHHAWVTHAQVLEGHSTGWNVLPLRARAGDMSEACARPQRPEPFLDTILLDHAPYLREVIDGLDATVSSVRLSALHAGGKIYEHSDGPGFEIGTAEEIRLHIPIVTSDDVWFVVDGERYFLRAGETWYGDFTRPHWVENRGSQARIHLTIDTRVSQTVLGLFPAEYLAGREVKVDRLAPDGSADLRALPGFTFEVEGAGALDRAVAQLPPSFQDLLRATFGQRNQVRWIDGKLWVLIGGRPTFTFEIESERRLRVAYQPAALEFDMVDGFPTNASLELAIMGEVFRMPLLIGRLPA